MTPHKQLAELNQEICNIDRADKAEAEVEKITIRVWLGPVLDRWLWTVHLDYLSLHGPDSHETRELAISAAKEALERVQMSKAKVVVCDE